jgi:tRNA pseudouridine55 synthase
LSENPGAWSGDRGTTSRGGPEGVLLVDKLAGPTSHDVVGVLRRVWRGPGGGVKPKVGHAGTLDPFATGLLIVLVGRATRLAEYVSQLDKTYVATLRLGAVSTTGDPQGDIALRDVRGGAPSRDAVVNALRAFVGEQEQVPPPFSAKRVAGRRAYEMARAKVPFTLAPVRIRIEAVELLRYDFPVAVHRLRTGPGAYVRSLARDVGEVLGTGGYLTALRREAIGSFSVEQALRVGDADPGGDLPPLVSLEAEALAERLLPSEAAAAHLPAYHVDAAEAGALSHGRPVARDDARLASGGEAVRPGGALRLISPSGFLGIGELSGQSLRGVKILYPDGVTSAVS